MNFHLRYAGAKVVETCLVGTGGFGRSFYSQSRTIPLISCRILIDLDIEGSVSALRDLGVAQDDYAICSSTQEAQSAWNKGQHIIANDVAHVIDLPFAVLIEATGHPEAGARHCRMAIEADKHVALVSKEVDSVIAPGLTHMAKEKGLVVTPVDGDQPSLLIGLITWAQVLGLEIVSAGKSSEYDFVYDEATNILSCNGQEEHLPQMAKVFSLDQSSAAHTNRQIISQRAKIAENFAQRAVPDLCEVSIVANATGFGFDREDLHAPIARMQEVPEFFRPIQDGGLFKSEQVLDVFHCLRRPDEVSLAGGVFIVVRCTDQETWKMLGEKGHILSSDLKTAMLTIPRHLLGAEAATSILDAALHKESSGGLESQHHFDLVARATADFPKGHHFKMGGHHHTMNNVDSAILPARKLDEAAPAPFYLAADKILKRDVKAGDLILMGDLELDETAELLSLRRMQDKLYFKSNEISNENNDRNFAKGGRVGKATA